MGVPSGKVVVAHGTSVAGRPPDRGQDQTMADPKDPKVRRSDTWAGLRAGDPVEIDDPRARRGTFAFVAHVEHLGSGGEWVEVVGGKRGDRKLWSFRPDQVYRVGAKGKGASLDEEPQLPF